MMSRQSELALTTLEHGPGPRHKGNPTSGLIRAEYALIDSDGINRYGEAIFRAGSETPVLLPFIALNPDTMKGGKGGEKQDDINKLLDTVRTVLKNSSSARKLHERSQIHLLGSDLTASDPEFNPRIFLDLENRIHVRARDMKEAKRFIRTFLRVRKYPALRDPARWRIGEVKGGTPHHVKMVSTIDSIFVCAAKAVYRVAVTIVGSKIFDLDPFPALRRLILTGIYTGECPVSHMGLFSMTSNGDHLVAFKVDDDEMSGIVSFAGSCYTVKLGWTSEQLQPLVAAACHCSREDRTTKLLPDARAQEMRAQLYEHVMQRLEEKTLHLPVDPSELA